MNVAIGLMTRRVLKLCADAFKHVETKKGSRGNVRKRCEQVKLLPPDFQGRCRALRSR